MYTINQINLLCCQMKPTFDFIKCAPLRVIYIIISFRSERYQISETRTPNLREIEVTNFIEMQ